MPPIQNAFCCSLYKRNCVCPVTAFLPAINFANFCQLLRVKNNSNTQAQLHFRDDQQMAFGISNISYWAHFCQLERNFASDYKMRRLNACANVETCYAVTSILEVG